VLRPRSNAGVLFQKEKTSEEVSGKADERSGQEIRHGEDVVERS
jgi:hypothetical protein